MSNSSPRLTLTEYAPPTTIRSPDLDVAARFRGTMANFPSTVSVISTGAGAGRRGFTATAVFSVTMEPPVIGVCVNKSVDAHETLIAPNSFCVNILNTKQMKIANRFAARDGSKGASRFDGDNWDELSTGAPSLRGAIGNVDCTVAASVDVGTHTILLGNVQDVRLTQATQPLVYFDRSYHQLLPVCAR